MASLTKKYILTFQKVRTKLWITYRKGIFLKLEVKGGGINEPTLKQLGKAIALNEEGIEAKTQEYDGRLTYKLIEKVNQSEHGKFMDRYLIFHEQFNLEAKTNPTQKKALNKIIEYLNNQSATKEEAFQVWDYLLTSWNNLSKFYQGQTQLNQIEHFLTNMLTQIKDGRKNTSTSQTITNDSMAKAFFDRYGKK